MHATAEAASMSEPTQESLFTTLPADDHVRMIQSLRDYRESVRGALQKQLDRRLEIAKRLNLACAERDDLLDGIGTHRDAREAVNQLAAAKKRCDQIAAEMASAHERQRALRAQLIRAEADVEAAIGGVQRQVVEAMLEVEPIQHQTAKSMRTHRQQSARDAAVRALRGMGGRASCVKLAAFLRLDPHGIGGLIDGDPRIRKTHDGRAQNLETWYELVDEAKA